jgi:hypothetical protein
LEHIICHSTGSQQAYPLGCLRYGLDPPGKLTIGSKICSELLGKLLSDLESMRQESLATMAEDEGSGLGLMGGEAGPLDDDDIGW